MSISQSVIDELSSAAREVAEDVEAARVRRHKRINVLLAGRSPEEVEFFRTCLVDALAGHSDRPHEKSKQKDDVPGHDNSHK